MPKKKAVPEPAPELEMEPVPTAEAAEDPSAAPAGIAEEAAALPDGDAAVTPIEEGAPKPDDPVPMPEGPPADGQDMALTTDAGGDVAPEAGVAPAPEILGLEPEPSPDAADGAGGDVSLLEGLAGALWPDSGEGAQADPAEWEQSPFSDPGEVLDGAAPAPAGAGAGAPDGGPPPDPADASADEGGAESGAYGDAEPGPEDVLAGEIVVTDESRAQAWAEGRAAQEEAAQTESVPRRRASRRARRADAGGTPGPSDVGGARADSGQAPPPSGGNDRHSFYDLDFNALDRGLSPEQRQEWNSIYASYRGHSVLTGPIAGVDRHSVRVRDRRTGEMMRQDNVIGEEVQMARTKNRGQQPVAPTYTARRWDAGKYIRLSKEDLKKAKEGKDDSNSVKNQRDLLDEFCERHADEFRSSEEYVDDGHTGTDADREDFQRLLSDVMSGKINCVIVKDLSRFARNYSDAGSLIDNLFVQMGVRFISLAENVDSYLNPDSVSNILVPITNVMNDNYCYQTSKKIRQVFDYKRRSGQYIGSFAPYGYVKDPEDKHRLVVDPEAAEVVKLIFSLFLRGTSKRAIALYLNEHDVPSPSAYRVSKGLPVPREAENPMWSSTSISKVLCNEIYTGDLIQGRRRVKSYKVHDIEAVPEEEWVRVPDTHEAIIDKATFEKVREHLKRDTRSAPKKRELHLFSGFLKCADCGRSVIRCPSKNNNVYYVCSTYKNYSRSACTMHSIKHNRLEAAVLFAVQQQVHLAVSYSDLVARINAAPAKRCQSHRLNDLIAVKERELAKISRYKQSLYQDWKDGEITRQEYHFMKADYEQKAASLTDTLARLTAERDELANGVNNEHPALTAFIKHENISTLTREILIELVDHIKVYDNGNISVKFKFADELRRIAEYIQLNTSSQREAG